MVGTIDNIHQNDRISILFDLLGQKTKAIVPDVNVSGAD